MRSWTHLAFAAFFLAITLGLILTNHWVWAIAFFVVFLICLLDGLA